MAPFRYLEGITHADVAFEATGATPEELFLSASDATLQVMIEDLGSIHPIEHREFTVTTDEDPSSAQLPLSRLEDLLFDYLQKLVYLKDAEGLLFRPITLRFEANRLHVDGHGERIDPGRHALGTDVKSVTLHRFGIERGAQGLRAVVVLDI